MAKTNADYCRTARFKRQAEAERLGLETVAVPMAKITKRQLNALVKRHGFQGVAELIQTLAASLDAMGDDVPAAVLRMPVSFEPSPELLREQDRFNAMMELQTEEDYPWNMS